MRIIVADNYLHMSEIAADMIAEIVKQKHDGQASVSDQN